MRPTLYNISGAPRGWRVLLGLAFKGLDADVRTLSLAEKDHQKPDFLALNPRATVPVLRDGETILRDSVAILAWLDRAHPEHPLFGETPEEAAKIWQIAMECNDYLRHAANELLSRVFTSDGSVPDRDSDAFKGFEMAADLMHAECAYLEELLGDGRSFLAGETPSAADAIAFPEIRLVQRGIETKHALMSALGFGYPPDLYPLTAAWKDSLNAMPSVISTLPGHWDEAPKPLSKSA